MKFNASFLALFVGVSMAFGQEPAPAASAPIFLAQASPAAPATKEPEPQDELITIPAKSAKSVTTTPETTPPTKSAQTEAATVTLWKLVQDGGWAMIPLAFLSIITVMLVLVYFFTLRRSAVLTAHYMNTADVLLKKRDYLGLLAISSRHSEAVARIVQRTLDFATKNPGAPFSTLREIAETEGAGQAATLQHRPVFLADIGMLAPMIGLLGTVIGIIRAFAKLGSGDASMSRDILLASGVSEALVATATGLILGIIAMGFYSIFRNKVQSLISDLEIASAHVLGMIALNYQKKRESPSRVAVDDEF